MWSIAIWRKVSIWKDAASPVFRVEERKMEGCGSYEASVPGIISQETVNFVTAMRTSAFLCN
jgi:hypothetical protein